ncbi:MAG TPA: pseudouridine synthase [Thermomicrobiales bacterium]|nr:pseudouridine synthase [Thermomicrobiales bacterium]
MERLQRILSHAGVASRRAAEEMIRAGRVTVNGQIVTEMGAKADPTRSTIRVDGVPIRRQQPRYILLNKPRGYITTTNDERDRRTVLDLVQVKQRVYPVGRLDRATEGLLLLTNDGEIANRVMHPRFGLTKEYHVLTTKRPSDTVLQRLRTGVMLDGKLIVPDEVRLLREEPIGIWLRVDLHEGMTHVVRRLMETAGIQVERLRRVRIGPLTVSGIPLGAWRDLTPGELGGLIEALKLDRPVTNAERAPRRAKTIHIQRPRPRPPRAASSVATPEIEESKRQQSRTLPVPATGRRGRGRPAPAPSMQSDETIAAVPTQERRPRNSRRRRGEPPAPTPKPKKAATRRDQRKGRTTRGSDNTGGRTDRPARSNRSRTPNQSATEHRPPQPKQQRQSPAPTNETRSGYDDPSRRRNRRARARDEAKSVSRRDRD